MILIGIVLATVLGGYGLLRQAESKPSTCPACRSRSLFADKHAVTWRCVPCQAQFVYWGGRFVPTHHTGPSGDEAVPVATLRKHDD